LREPAGHPTIPPVDPVTHSLTGAALSRAGLNRTTPLATATLVMAANVPDIDILAYAQGSYASLAFRRGITHGPLAMLLLPVAVAAVMLAYDRLWRRRRQKEAAPARPLPLLGLALIGVLTHSPLDWLNTYGIRLLMPFSERWFYGDSLFIIDPWVWLVLGAPLVCVYTATRRGRLLWGLLAAAATALVLAAGQVPVAAQLLWLAGVAAVIGSVVMVHRRGISVGVRPARVALGATAAYIILMMASDAAASTQVRHAAEAAGMDVHGVMVAPVPANPLAGEIVVEGPESYHLGTFGWLDRPRIQWEPRTIAKGERNEVVLATLQLREVRDFLRWSRFPYVQVTETGTGHVVRFGDARYPAGMRGGLAGVTVEVEGTLRVRPEQ
jgi:inner membrane protein